MIWLIMITHDIQYVFCEIAFVSAKTVVIIKSIFVNHQLIIYIPFIPWHWTIFYHIQILKDTGLSYDT